MLLESYKNEDFILSVYVIIASFLFFNFAATDIIRSFSRNNGYFNKLNQDDKVQWISRFFRKCLLHKLLLMILPFSDTVNFSPLTNFIYLSKSIN